MALALVVHLINALTLDEFSHAVRAVDGRLDLSFSAAQDVFDDRATYIALHGGYSDSLVVKEDFVLKIPKNLKPEA